MRKIDRLVDLGINGNVCDAARCTFPRSTTFLGLPTRARFSFTFRLIGFALWLVFSVLVYADDFSFRFAFLLLVQVCSMFHDTTDFNANSILFEDVDPDLIASISQHQAFDCSGLVIDLLPFDFRIVCHQDLSLQRICTVDPLSSRQEGQEYRSHDHHSLRNIIGISSQVLHRSCTRR